MKTRTCAMGWVLMMVLAGILPTRANDIEVSNVTWANATPDGESYVRFNLRWENSWRAQWDVLTDDSVTGELIPVKNWDAAWVFVKFRPTGTSDGYTHARLSTNAVDHVMPAGATNTVGLTDGKGVGVFIYRDAPGHGTNDWQNVQLRWLHASNNVVNADSLDIQVHAIEMVYVDQGPFSAGCGGIGFTKTTIVTNDATVAGGYPTGQTAPAYSDWPNGYNAFYCMKYEVTQGQWADYLNALPVLAADARYHATTDNRYTVTKSSGVYSASRRDRACNFLSWEDLRHYAAWAGLRPMTELEFEKACRGPVKPVANEFAWGTASIRANAILTLSGSEDGTELVTTDVSLGAAVYGNKEHSGGDGGFGPLRVGIFATASSTRVQAGASYWGIMELTGNLWKRAVPIGGNYRGTHGSGSVGGIPADWPASGGVRGGNWNNADAQARVSDRTFAGFPIERTNIVGIRVVRSAP